MSVTEVSAIVAAFLKVFHTRQMLALSVLLDLNDVEVRKLQARALANRDALYADPNTLDYASAWVGMTLSRPEHWFLTDDELRQEYGAGSADPMARWQLEGILGEPGTPAKPGKPGRLTRVLSTRAAVQFTFYMAPLKPHMLWLTDPHREAPIRMQPRE